jgi:hypothetical protein
MSLPNPGGFFRRLAPAASLRDGLARNIRSGSIG